MSDRFRVARARMVERIRGKGLANETVLAAMGEIPRHLYVDPALELKAYGENALPIGWEQTLSHPEVVAFMTESLSLRPGLRILEIGTGSGYQAALLARLGASVRTIERIEGLLGTALEHWKADGFRGDIKARLGDGYLGWPEEGPFDRILLTASPREVPETLLRQLKEDGILLLPLATEEGQRMVRVRRGGDRAYREELGECSFVPMLARTVKG
ncbi:protein-L-isoaspartate(D-aspartate) O-methyltransferase [bacterium]|nr:protein-L-isoaspartate(D-aspartate) O-methyltransferase [bacterium]